MTSQSCDDALARVRAIRRGLPVPPDGDGHVEEAEEAPEGTADDLVGGVDPSGDPGGRGGWSHDEALTFVRSLKGR
ncbi:hypothetical protein GCM10023066_27170 [Nocardioides kongjuensis]